MLFNECKCNSPGNQISKFRKDFFFLIFNFFNIMNEK